MKIALAAEEYLKPLSEIYSQAFTEADPTKPWTQERAFNLLSHFYKIQPDLFFITFEEDNIVGAMAVIIKPWREGNRCTEGILFVHPKYQRSGIGKKLFVHLLDKAITNYSADTFEAITFAAKEFPLTWYESIGLVQDKDAVLIKGRTQEMLNKLKAGI
jgi:GNAT superfamily N-acetyltransferase